MPKSLSSKYYTNRPFMEKLLDTFEYDYLNLDYENITEKEYVDCLLRKGKFKGTDFSCKFMELIEPYFAEVVADFIKSKSDESWLDETGN